MYADMPLSGNFVFIDYYILKDDNTYDEPLRSIRVRMQDYGASDLAEDTSREFQEQDINGRIVRKYNAKVQLSRIRGLVPKVGDKVFVHFNSKDYFVKEIGFAWESMTMMDTINFGNKKGIPTVLELGDRR